MKGIDPSWVHLNRFFTPRARGVKIANFAIVPERGTLPFRPFGDLFACIFRRGSRPSRAAAFVFPALGGANIWQQKSASTTSSFADPINPCCGVCLWYVYSVPIKFLVDLLNPFLTVRIFRV